MPRQSLSDIFLPSEISDRKAATAAVAAGSISGALLTLFRAITTAMLFLRRGVNPGNWLCFAATAFLAMVTVGTWKRVLIAPILGMPFGGALVVWGVTHGTGAAVILVLPFVGGFWTAVRGIATLKRLRTDTHVNRSPH